MYFDLVLQLAPKILAVAALVDFVIITVGAVIWFWVKQKPHR